SLREGEADHDVGSVARKAPAEHAAVVRTRREVLAQPDSDTAAPDGEAELVVRAKIGVVAGRKVSIIPALLLTGPSLLEKRTENPILEQESGRAPRRRERELRPEVPVARLQGGVGGEAREAARE